MEDFRKISQEEKEAFKRHYEQIHQAVGRKKNITKGHKVVIKNFEEANKS